MKHRCAWPGCPACYVRPEYARRHESLLHLVCTCGRNFTLRGFPAHMASVKRHGIGHPPFPRPAVGETEAHRRARRMVPSDLPLLSAGGAR